MLNNRFFALLAFANTDSVGFRLPTGSNAPHSNYALDPQTWPIISFFLFVFEKCGFASISCSCFRSGMFEIYVYIYIHTCFAVLPGFLYNLGMTLSSRDPGSCDGRVSSWYLVWMGAEGRDVEL